MQKLELAIAIIVFVDVPFTLEKLANYATKLAKKYNISSKIQENIASFVNRWRLLFWLQEYRWAMFNLCKYLPTFHSSQSFNMYFHNRKVAESKYFDRSCWIPYQMDKHIIHVAVYCVDVLMLRINDVNSSLSHSYKNNYEFLLLEADQTIEFQ